MNDRHRRVAKLRKQELNVAKKKLEKEYGVSVADTVKAIKIFADTVGSVAEAVGNTLASIGRNLQGK
ncbi:toxin PIN [Enterococcus hirae]|uniref:toxin PIN n=1 Tax=Enterococcus hirae TaxID=1354 RepID=UPI001F3F2FB7|nr:toxin PIN [Enterococcus hirae]